MKGNNNTDTKGCGTESPKNIRSMVPSYSKQTLKRSLQMYDELERVRRKILQPKKLLLEVRKTPCKATYTLPNKNEKRCHACINCKKKEFDKFPCQNPVTFDEYVAVLPFYTACEKVSSARENSKS